MADNDDTKPLSKTAEKYRQLVSRRKRPKDEQDERLSLVLGEAPDKPEAPVPPLLQPSPQVSPSTDRFSATADRPARNDPPAEPHKSTERELPRMPFAPAISASPQPLPRFLQSKQRGKVLLFSPRKKSKLSKSRRLQKHPWLS